MKIIVDAMGGDNAPAEIVKGAVRAQRELGVSVTLVGKAEEVRACLEREGTAEQEGVLEIVDAREIVTMEDGRVCERGTHEELLERGGTYARYYRMQFGDAVE